MKSVYKIKTMDGEIIFENENIQLIKSSSFKYLADQYSKSNDAYEEIGLQIFLNTGNKDMFLGIVTWNLAKKM